MCDSRLTELDQILVCGSWMQATDVKVGFAELLCSTVAVAAAIAEGSCVAVAIAIAVGTWRSHLMVGGGHICLLKKKLQPNLKLCNHRGNIHFDTVSYPNKLFKKHYVSFFVNNHYKKKTINIGQKGTP